MVNASTWGEVRVSTVAHADFNGDIKDAGEIGAGHSVIALYEVIPKGSKIQKSDPKLAHKK